VSASAEHTPHTIDSPGQSGEMAEQPHDEMRNWFGAESPLGARGRLLSCRW